MNTELTVDRTKLIGYARPVPKRLKGNRIEIALATLCLITMPIYVISWLPGYHPLSTWTVRFICAFVLVIGAFSILLTEVVRYIVEEKADNRVPQGIIVGKDTRGGGITKLRWIILVKGFNRFNQIQIHALDVHAGDWHEKFTVGTYVDFRNEDEVEQSMEFPVPEPSLGAEM